MRTVILTLLLAFSAFAADVTGKWTASIDGPEGKMEIVFNFQMAEGKLTGTVTGPIGDMPITEGKVDGDSIVFTVTGGDFKAIHKGTISGSEMKLKAEMGERSFEMTAKKAGA
jgi:hypothetical protein